MEKIKKWKTLTLTSFLQGKKLFQQQGKFNFASKARELFEEAKK